MQTIDQLIRQRAGDAPRGPGLRGPDAGPTTRWSQAQAERAALLASLRDAGPVPRRPAARQRARVRVLDGRGGAGRRGARRGQPDPPGRRAGPRPRPHRVPAAGDQRRLRRPGRGPRPRAALPPERVLVVDDPTGDLGHGPATPYGALLASVAGAPLPDPAETAVTEESLGLLLFTSGTSGAPKACLCSQGRLARIGGIVAQMFELTEDDVCYLAMPLFHSNALMAGWAPALAAGATAVLRERFSASGFLDDVRRYGVTYFNYVGKPLSYILATPERPDDADNTAAPVPSATRPPRPTWPGSPSGSAAPCRTPTGRPRAGRRCSAPPTPRVGRSAGPCPAPWSSTPRPGEECPAGRLRRARAPAQRRGGHRRAGQPDRRRRLRGLLAQRRRRGGPAAQRLVLDRRPRLPGRGRLLLLRRPRLRLAARRRGELRRRPGRGHPPAPPRRGAGLGLRGARHRGRRPGHGHAAAPPRATLRSGRVRRLPGRPGRPGHQVGAPLRAGHRRPAGDGHHQGAQAGPAQRGLAVSRSRCGGAPSRTPPTGPLTTEDADALDKAVAAPVAERQRPAPGRPDRTPPVHHHRRKDRPGQSDGASSPGGDPFEPAVARELGCHRRRSGPVAPAGVTAKVSTRSLPPVST